MNAESGQDCFVTGRFGFMDRSPWKVVIVLSTNGPVLNLKTAVNYRATEGGK